MLSNWHDSARRLFAERPEVAGRIVRDLLKADLPPAIQYTLLTPLCGDEPCAGERCGDGVSVSATVPEMVVLAGPLRQPVHAIVVEFQQGRDDETRHRWPMYAAAIWLCHGCPVDLLVVCPDVLTAHWADRPVATTLDGYVCRPAVLVLEDPGTIGP